MISNGDATVLLSAIILDKKIYKIVKETLDDPVFNPATQFAHDFILKQFMDMSEEAKEPVSLSMLSSRITDAIELLDDNDHEWFEEIDELFRHIDEASKEVISEKYAMDLVQMIANEQIHEGVENLLVNIMEREGPDTYQTKLTEDVGKIVRSKQVTKVDDNYVQPLLALNKMMISSKAWPVGVDFFDEMTGGGIRTGRLWGFLAPPAGGKTTMAVQLGMNWVRQGPNHHTMLALYEQPPEGDITSRILCQTTGEDVSMFRDVTLDQLSPEIIEDIQNKSAGFANRLHAFDFSKPGQGTRGLEDIKDALERIGLLHKITEIDTTVMPPVFIIVDWLIPWFQRKMTEEGKIAIGQDLRGYGTKLMDEIKAFKNMYNVIFLINHQITTKAGAASATRAPSWSDAAEWSGFAWMLDDCFGVGNRTDEDIAIMAAVKARATARSKIFVKLDGAHCRFVDVTNDYMVQNGKMVQKSMQTVKRGSSTSQLTKSLIKKLPTDVNKIKENFT